VHDFKPFAEEIHASLHALKVDGHELFVTDVGGDELWSLYLAAFPEGSNQIYRKRQEYDCSCCKHFIRNVGNVVGIAPIGELMTIWGGWATLEYPFNEVARKLHEAVSSSKIIDIYRTTFASYGAEETKALEEGKVVRWNHFHTTLFSPQVTRNADAERGNYRTVVQVFKRGLDELKPEALDDVISLIDNGSLYRGEEHSASVKAFDKMQRQYLELNEHRRELFCWTNAGHPNARFRNTVIGTLVDDLSQGKDLEASVKSFESKVAPTNYKRPTALITPKMVQDAMATIGLLGLEPALQRRYARLSDVSVNNVLWADSSAARIMRSPIENALMDSAVRKGKGKVRDSSDIGIDEFVKDVLPGATGLDVLVKGSILSNLVSITAPVHNDGAPLFKWDNGFAWSYDGNITDSNIREKVKQAGGNVTNAALRISLAWFNYDDLDIYVLEPNGNTICFHNKGNKLDVDMNAGYARSREAVENVSFRPDQLRDGTYRVAVHQYMRRETIDNGFQIEIENQGKIYHLSYAPAVKETVEVAQIVILNGKIEGIAMAKNIVGGGFSHEKWGIKTETFVKVQTMMLSPNYWDGNRVGNKHWFFLLEGCKNPDPTRGIYNEFLRSDLEKHRKVFEILGDKTKCPPSDDQLSGLGFSSTKGDTLTVQVTGPSTKKTFNLSFNKEQS
jgi:hypothetical protein